MKKGILLFCFLLIGVVVKAQKDCTLYHKGYFMYIDSAGNTILVQRRNRYQYEYNRKIKVRIQFLIDWKNDCEYTITQTLTNSKALKKNKNFFTEVVISKSDGDNGYYYRCVCKDDIVERKEKFMKKITKQEFYQRY